MFLLQHLPLSSAQRAVRVLAPTQLVVQPYILSTLQPSVNEEPSVDKGRKEEMKERKWNSTILTILLPKVLTKFH